MSAESKRAVVLTDSKSSIVNVINISFNDNSVSLFQTSGFLKIHKKTTRTSQLLSKITNYTTLRILQEQSVIKFVRSLSLIDILRCNFYNVTKTL